MPRAKDPEKKFPPHFLENMYSLSAYYLKWYEVAGILEIAKRPNRNISEVLRLSHNSSIKKIRVHAPEGTGEEFDSYQVFKKDSLFLSQVHVLRTDKPVSLDKIFLDRPYAVMWLEHKQRSDLPGIIDCIKHADYFYFGASGSRICLNDSYAITDAVNLDIMYRFELRSRHYGHRTFTIFKVIKP